MKGSTSKLRLLLFSVVFLFFIGLYAIDPMPAEEVEVQDIIHSPNEPPFDGSFKVTINLGNNSNVDDIEIFMCTMDPFVCFYSGTMTDLGNGAYESTIELGDFDLKNDTIIGYNFEITYNNATKEKIPDDSMMNDYDNILKVGEDVYYLTLTLGEGMENEEEGEQVEAIPFINMIMMLMGIIIFMIIVFYLYRTKSNNEK
jgi:hypothetical protein